MLNGVTKLIMMKSDVMDLFPTIKACVAYEIDGKETRNFPFHLTEGVTPVYKELPGWQQSMTNVVSEADFPKEFSDYIAFLEKELGVGIAIVSVGPDREQTIIRQA
jgi:adenylosuccinate synthase